MNYKLNIDDQFEFEFNEENIQNIDITPSGENQFHIIKDNQSYIAKIVESDFNNRTISIEINGSVYNINISDENDELVKKLGLTVVAGQKMKNVKAPMPGLVLEVSVKVGQEIAKGDGLLILEAMKMENVIKAAGEGIVKSINIEKGNTVDKGELLLEME